MSRNTPHCLGVLGGMGPLAGAHFAFRLVQLTPATCDQEHIPVLLRNNPRIPDRSSAWVSGGASPLPAMMRGVTMLQEAGADCIAIPCNTAHLWFEQLQAATSARLLHIVEAVLRDLRNQGVEGGRVGILGTRATLETGLYQRFLLASGYEPLVPVRHDALRDCTEAIVAVKASRVADALAPLTRSIEALRLQGACAVVLGCTELPIALPQARRDTFGVVIVDCIDALAREAVRQFKGSSPLSARRYAQADLSSSRSW